MKYAFFYQHGGDWLVNSFMREVPITQKWTGFYMIGTSAMKELKAERVEGTIISVETKYFIRCFHLSSSVFDHFVGLALEGLTNLSNIFERVFFMKMK